MACVDAGTPYIPSPIRKRPKTTTQTTNNPHPNTDQNENTAREHKDKEFETLWTRFHSFKSTKEISSREELRALKKFGLILAQSELETARDWHYSGNCHHYFEFDSTPFSSRVRLHLSQWAIDKSSSVLNFSSGIAVEHGEGAGTTKTTQTTKTPFVAPSFLLPKKATDEIHESEKIFAAVAHYLGNVIKSCAPLNDESGGSPFAICVSADWASSNLLCMLYVLAFLDTHHGERNYTVTISRCLAHVHNNNSLHASTKFLNGAFDKTNARDAGSCLWKRCQLLSHHALTLERCCEGLTSQDVVVRGGANVAGGAECGVTRTRELMNFLNQGEDEKTCAALQKAGVYNLGFFESKIVFVVDSAFSNSCYSFNVPSSSSSCSNSISASIIAVSPEGEAFVMDGTANGNGTAGI